MRQAIVITEGMPGYFEIHSLLGIEQTAKLLSQFAEQAIKKSAIQQYKKKMDQEGKIINPHTGKPVPSNGSFKKELSDARI
jgi:hypothetical protein